MRLPQLRAARAVGQTRHARIQVITVRHRHPIGQRQLRAPIRAVIADADSGAPTARTATDPAIDLTESVAVVTPELESHKSPVEAAGGTW
jgi:hypothetical protein